MKKTMCMTLVSLLWMVGCSQTPPTTRDVSTTTETESQQLATVDSSKSRVVSVEANGRSRTEANSRSSHSDPTGSHASVSVSASRQEPDGETSQRNAVMKVSSEGDDQNSLGYTQDDKNIAITGSNVTKTWTADGQDVAISGSNNTLQFLGNTHGLSVTGNGNKVQVDNPSLVEVSGQSNEILYTGTPPTITKNGEHNVVVMHP